MMKQGGEQDEKKVFDPLRKMETFRSICSAIVIPQLKWESMHSDQSSMQFSERIIFTVHTHLKQDKLLWPFFKKAITDN